jgi:hypothetical protein
MLNNTSKKLMLYTTGILVAYLCSSLITERLYINFLFLGIQQSTHITNLKLMAHTKLKNLNSQVY